MDLELHGPSGRGCPRCWRPILRIRSNCSSCWRGRCCSSCSAQPEPPLPVRLPRGPLPLGLRPPARRPVPPLPWPLRPSPWPLALPPLWPPRPPGPPPRPWRPPAGPPQLQQQPSSS